MRGFFYTYGGNPDYYITSGYNFTQSVQVRNGIFRQSCSHSLVFSGLTLCWGDFPWVNSAQVNKTPSTSAPASWFKRQPLCYLGMHSSLQLHMAASTQLPMIMADLNAILKPTWHRPKVVMDGQYHEEADAPRDVSQVLWGSYILEWRLFSA